MAMASSPSSLISFPLQLLRYTPSSSSTRLRPGTVYRHYSPSARLQMQPTSKGRFKSVTVVTAASYEDQDEATVGHGDNGIAARTSLLRHVADEVAPPELELLRVGCGAPCSSPKGGTGQESEDDGGGGGKIHHAAAPTVVKRACGPTPPGLPKEGSGGNGGSKH